MKITEVRIKLIDNSDDRLRAFCSITVDDAFVIRDLKIIDGTSGPFVAMPSRKLTAHCPQCNCKNHLRAQHCNQCGVRLKMHAGKDQDGKTKLYADIAHPINSECREFIQQRVIAAFQEELALSKQPGYVSHYDDFMDYDNKAEAMTPTAESMPSAGNRSSDKPSRDRASSKITRVEGKHSPPQPRPSKRHHRSSRTSESPKGVSETSNSPQSDDDQSFGAGIF